MSRIGFLSHSDMSVYYFRLPIMKALKELGHEVFAIIPNGNYSKKIAKNFDIITYEIDRASLNPFKIMQETKKLAKILSPLKLDLLQTAAHKPNIFGTKAAKLANIKVVINLVEGLGSFYTSKALKTKAIKAVIEYLYKKTFCLSQATIFVNDADPDYMLWRGLIIEDKVRRIKSVGINSKDFNPYNCEPYKFGNKKIILMMGRALWDKGIREFYEASKILNDRNDCEFVFVGDSDKGNKSCADEKFLNSPFVRHIKWSNQVKELLKASYIFVLPSYQEGFPRTILEAMSMEVACVTSNSAGCNEAVIDGINGLLCEVKNSKDLANKIENLLNNPDLTEKLGKKGRELVLKRYDESIIIPKYLDVYKEFIDV